MADKRELTLDLLAEDKTGPATTSAARNLDDVADSADGASKSTEELGKSSEDTAKKTEALGKGASQNSRDLGTLQTQIDLTKRELGGLAQSYARAGDAGQRSDISKGIRDTEAELRKLEKAKSILTNLIPNDDGGKAKNLGQKIVAGIASGISSGGDAVAELAGNNVGLVVAGAAAAAIGPTVASALMAAITGGIGVGGIIGGVALAAKDPVVADTAHKIGQTFLSGLEKEAQVFQLPLLNSLNMLKQAGVEATAKIGGAFSTLAPQLEPLTGKLIKAGDALLDSFVGAVGRSGPALDALGDSVVMLAGSVGDFITDLSEGGPTAAANLRLVAGATSDLIKVTGDLLGWLNKLSANSWITGPLLPLLRKHYNETADSSDTLGQKTQELATKMTDAEAAANGQRTALAALSKEIQGETDPVFGLLNAEDALKTAQNNVADATKKHGKNSQETQTAVRGLAQAAVDLEGKAGALGATFNGKLTPEMIATFKAAGLTNSEISQVAKQFRNAKSDGDKFARDYAATSTLTTVYKTLYSTNNETSPSAGSAIRGARAGGGPVKKGAAYIVGEKRPEVFVPDRDGTIVPSIDQATAAYGGGAAAGGGQQAAAAPLIIKAGTSDVEQLLVNILSAAVKRRGGVVQNVLGKTGRG